MWHGPSAFHRSRRIVANCCSAVFRAPRIQTTGKGLSPSRGQCTGCAPQRSCSMVRGNSPGFGGSTQSGLSAVRCTSIDICAIAGFSAPATTSFGSNPGANCRRRPVQSTAAPGGKEPGPAQTVEAPDVSPPLRHLASAGRRDPGQRFRGVRIGGTNS